MSERRITLQRPIRNQRPLELEVAIHPLSNGVIVVNYPELTEDLSGNKNKYGEIADFIQEKRIGTVVRMGNPWYDRLHYPDGMIKRMIGNFKYVLEYCISHGEELSGKANPTLYLMGFSSGAGTIASVAGDYSEVEKILLMAPSGDPGQPAYKRLGKFKGEVYITIGGNDEVLLGPRNGQIFYNLSTAAKVRKLEIISNCDHNFSGDKNGKIMSKAPLWAFAGDTTFPSPEGGKALYR